MSWGFYTHKVEHTPEFDRIAKLPRRVWTEAERQAAVINFTAALKTPQGSMTLMPDQAMALAEIGCLEGGFCSLPAGAGKTLISLLAPYVLKAKRPVLLMPASLIAKTARERIKLSNHWRIPLTIRLSSYESLGRAGHANDITIWKPDLLLLDEAHRIKNPKAAVTRRVIRFMKENPDVRFIALSGTMSKHSLLDYAHLAAFSLKQGAPVPLVSKEVERWAEVLDEGQALKTHPGALLELCTPEEKQREDPCRAARLGYQRRLLATPGVIAARESKVGASLIISAVTHAVDHKTEANFDKLRRAWMTPDDWMLMQAVEVWALARQLSAGLHYAWSPRPPPAWMEARALWGKFVRKTLAYSKHLDSPLQVQMAVESGEIEDTVAAEREGEWREERNVLARWKHLEPTFKPNSVPLWHDESCLRFCEEWGKKSPGIIWTEHSFFARQLAKRTGWDYFGRDGVNEHEVPIDLEGASHAGKTIIASRKANATGRNLQAWNRNLITSLPASPDDLEQLIARTHRTGQEADEVLVDILFTCAEHLNAWTSCLRKAEVIRDTLGQDFRILTGDVTVEVSELQKNRGPRWQTTLSEKEPGFAPVNT